MTMNDSNFVDGMRQLGEVAEQKPAFKDHIRFVYVANPFEPSVHEVKDIPWDEGDVAFDYLETLADEFESFEVSLSGKPIATVDEWRSSEVLEGDCLVVIQKPLGDDLKVILAIVFIVFISIVAFGAPAAFGGAGMFSATGGGIAGAITGGLGYAVGMGIMIAGAMLVNKLMAVKPDTPTGGDMGETSYGIDGPKNTSEEGLPVPLIYGTYRAAGNVIGIWTENTGNTQNLYMKLALSEGPVQSISNILVNDTPIENFAQQEWELLYGYDTQSPFSIGNSAKGWITKAVGAELDTLPITVITDGPVDQIRVDLIAPGGLGYFNDDGGIDGKQIYFTIQARRIGFDWKDVGSDGPDDEFYYEYTYFYYVAKSTNTVHEDGALVLAHSTHVLEDPNFLTANNEIRDPSAFNEDPNLIGTASPQGYYYESTWIGGNQTQPLRKSYLTTPLPEGIYEITVERTTAKNGGTKHIEMVNFDSIVGIVHEPVNLNNTAALLVKMQLDDQLGSIPKITSQLEGKVIEWMDDSGEWQTPAASDNPAWVCYDIMTNARYGAGIDSSRIDLVRFKEWSDYCIEQELTFNGVFDAQMNVWDAVQYVLGNGHARFINVGTKFSVAIDRPSEPVQLFNSTSIEQGSLNQNWLSRSERANEVEIAYFDKGSNYRKRQTKVYTRQYAAGAKANTANLRMYGVTSERQANREAVYSLNQAQLLNSTVAFTAPLEAVTVVPGDVFVLQHDQANWNDGGRVNNWTRRDRIMLDRPIELLPDQDYRAMVRFDSIRVAQGNIVSVNASQQRIDIGEEALHRMDRFQANGLDVAILRVKGNSVYVDEISPYTAGDSYEIFDVDAIETRVITSIAGTYEDFIDVDADFPVEVGQVGVEPFTIGQTDKVEDKWRCTKMSYSSKGKVKINAINYNPEVYDWSKADNFAAYLSEEALYYGAENVVGLQASESTKLIGSQYTTVINLSWSVPLVQVDDPIWFTEEDLTGSIQKRYVFKRWPFKPGRPIGDIVPDGWSDTVPPETGEPLWYTHAAQNGSGQTQGLWYDPIQSPWTADPPPWPYYAGADVEEFVERAGWVTLAYIPSGANEFAYNVGTDYTERKFRVVAKSIDDFWVVRSTAPQVTITPIGDQIAPDEIEDFNAVPGATGGIQIDWTNPTAGDFYGVVLARNTHPYLAGATTIRRTVGAENSFLDLGVTDPGIDYWYFIEPQDTSGNTAIGWTMHDILPVNVKSGLGALQIVASNSVAVIPADSSGVVIPPVPSEAYAGQCQVWCGANDVTELATISLLSSAGGSAEVNGATGTPIVGKPRGYYQATGFTNAATELSFVIRASYEGKTADSTIVFSKVVDSAGFSIELTAPTQLLTFDHQNGENLPNPAIQEIPITLNVSGWALANTNVGWTLERDSGSGYGVISKTQRLTARTLTSVKLKGHLAADWERVRVTANAEHPTDPASNVTESIEFTRIVSTDGEGVGGILPDPNFVGHAMNSGGEWFEKNADGVTPPIDPHPVADGGEVLNSASMRMYLNYNDYALIRFRDGSSSPVKYGAQAGNKIWFSAKYKVSNDTWAGSNDDQWLPEGLEAIVFLVNSSNQIIHTLNEIIPVERSSRGTWRVYKQCIEIPGGYPALDHIEFGIKANNWSNFEPASTKTTNDSYVDFDFFQFYADDILPPTMLDTTDWDVPAAITQTSQLKGFSVGVHNSITAIVDSSSVYHPTEFYHPTPEKLKSLNLLALSPYDGGDSGVNVNGGPLIRIDPTKTYRFTGYVSTRSSAVNYIESDANYQNATVKIGFAAQIENYVAGNYIEALDNSAVSTAWSFGDAASPNTGQIFRKGRTYFFSVYVRPESTVDTGSEALSALYDPNTGGVIARGVDFKFAKPWTQFCLPQILNEYGYSISVGDLLMEEVTAETKSELDLLGIAYDIVPGVTNLIKSDHWQTQVTRYFDGPENLGEGWFINPDLKTDMTVKFEQAFDYAGTAITWMGIVKPSTAQDSTPMLSVKRELNPSKAYLYAVLVRRTAGAEGPGLNLLFGDKTRGGDNSIDGSDVRYKGPIVSFKDAQTNSGGATGNSINLDPVWNYDLPGDDMHLLIFPIYPYDYNPSGSDIDFYDDISGIWSIAGETATRIDPPVYDAASPEDTSSWVMRFNDKDSGYVNISIGDWSDPNDAFWAPDAVTWIGAPTLLEYESPSDIPSLDQILSWYESVNVPGEGVVVDEGPGNSQLWGSQYLNFGGDRVWGCSPTFSAVMVEPGDVHPDGWKQIRLTVEVSYVDDLDPWEYTIWSGSGSDSPAGEGGGYNNYLLMTGSTVYDPVTETTTHSVTWNSLFAFYINAPFPITDGNNFQDVFTKSTFDEFPAPIENFISTSFGGVSGWTDLQYDFTYSN